MTLSEIRDAIAQLPCDTSREAKPLPLQLVNILSDLASEVERLRVEMDRKAGLPGGGNG